MVTVTVLFEGGADPRSNPNADTMDNTTKLRESFNTLLNAGLPNEQIKIAAMPTYSITNIIQRRENNTLLLMDLDGPKSQKEKRITDNNLTDIADTVFFMVQQMEAWILSQPKKIYEAFENTGYTAKPNLENDPKIAGQNMENLPKPDEILNTLLQRYFTITKIGKKKKLKYGKLKHAPQLIAALSIEQLALDFDEVSALLAKVKKFISA